MKSSFSKENPNPICKSVTETGAQVGDRVMCVKSGEPNRFYPGKVYRVDIKMKHAYVKGELDAFIDGRNDPCYWPGHGCLWQLMPRPTADGKAG